MMGSPPEAAGSQPRGAGSQPRGAGSHPRQWGGLALCWPSSWVLPAQGARVCSAPRTPHRLLPPVAKAVGVSEGPHTTNYLRKAESPVNRGGGVGVCIRGEQGAGGRAQVPSKKPGRTSRTCPVAPHRAGPGSSAALARHPGLRLPPRPSPAPGNAGGPVGTGSAAAPGSGAPLRSGSPQRSVPGSAAAPAALCLPAGMRAGPRQRGQPPGSAGPGRDLGENRLEAARKWGVIVTAQVTVTA